MRTRTIEGAPDFKTKRQCPSKSARHDLSAMPGEISCAVARVKGNVYGRHRTARRTQLVTALPLFLLLGLLSFHPIAVDAHALLVASSPAAGQRIDATLHSVTLTFDEPVEARLSSIRVLDSAGAERSLGQPIHPTASLRTLSIRTAPLRHGQFIVAWRVVSVDSHLESGAFAFGVGAAAGHLPRTLAHPLEAGLAPVLAVLHIGEIATLLIAIGLTIAFITVPGCEIRLAPIGRGAWIALSAVAFVQFFGQAEAIGIEPLHLLATRLGALRVVLVLGGIVGAVALRAQSRTLLILAALTVTGGDVLSGHAVTGATPALGIAVQSVHLVAAASWIGVLLAALGAPTSERKRISAVAATSALVLALTALPQALRNIAATSALTTTVYGRFVCVKASLFALTLAAAARSHWLARRRTAGTGVSIRFELTLLAGVTLATGLLVDTTPPRAATIPAPRAENDWFRLADRQIDVSVASAIARVQAYEYAFGTRSYP
jgi:copper transport protein